MALNQQVGSGGVIVVMNAEVDDESMMRRGGVGCERVEPRERVGPLRATDVELGSSGWAKFLSGGAGDVPKAVAGCGNVWEVE